MLKQNINPARSGDGHMDDLKRLRIRLEGAMKITEAELQKSVFKSVTSTRCAPPVMARAVPFTNDDADF